jgi:signal transduction histidine kinase
VIADVLRPFTRSRVLVVDDNQANALLASRILLHAGLSDLHTIEDPREVASWVHEQRPDLILLDLHMPYIDGFTVLADLRVTHTLTDLPVIVLTADTEREASQRAFEAGASDFLTKPLDASEVVHRVRNLLEMKSAYSAREAFFSSLSHDVRSPLTAIAGFAELLPDVSADQRSDLIDRIIANATRLRTLFDALVDHAKIRSGAAEVSTAPFDVRPVALACVRDLGSLLDDHPVTVDDASMTVLGDPKAMDRVFTNLLVNAAKYSGAGSPIDIRFGRNATHGEISVVDRGRGILKEDIPLIFEEFHRGGLARNDGGAGIGLTSVRALVEQQGGQVRLESEEGEGTTVTVVLPLAETVSA